jgi:hypothetical protein
MQGRCTGPETRALLAAILSCHGSLCIVPSDCRACWRAASTEAVALYVIVAGCWRAPKTFPKRAHKRAFSPLVRIIWACVPSE